MKLLSAAVEDYLKTIHELELEADGDRVGTSELAQKLGVSNASVTGMLKKLAEMEPQLVDYERYQGVRLTGAGRKIALEVVRHHRLIEAYLIEALGYTWDEVHDEAEKLEHVISEDLEDRIAAYLGHPTLDPHGDPIPDREGNMAELEERQLTQLEAGERGTITRVSDNPDLLRYLDQLELALQAEVEVVKRAPFEGPIHVRRLEAESVHALSRKVTDQVFVSPQSTSMEEGTG
ncbi:MAG: metal-dependent transcriptional regulator [Anaerolineales bacterium]|nr:metal-dependent transcriptional regulator [Anaerolineales bacterium]